jgi:hypothetical protein
MRAGQEGEVGDFDLCSVDVVDVDDAVEVAGEGKGSWTERLRTQLQLGSHLQVKRGIFPNVPAVRSWAL